MHILHGFLRQLQCTRYSTKQVPLIQCCEQCMPLPAQTYLSSHCRHYTPSLRIKLPKMQYRPIYIVSGPVLLSLHPVPCELLQHLQIHCVFELRNLFLNNLKTTIPLPHRVRSVINRFHFSSTQYSALATTPQLHSRSIHPTTQLFFKVSTIIRPRPSRSQVILK